MKITKETVEQISELSHLKPTEQESRRLAEELERIVGYFGILSRLPFGDAEPMNHILPVKNVLREDEVCPSLPRGRLLANAPASDGETFLVPMTVEQEE